MKQYPYRVYYEDTDAGGVVYYANYLKYAERARTEMLRDLGISQQALKVSDDILFVVNNVSMQLKKPAILDDMIIVTVEITNAKAASLAIEQKIMRDDVCLAVILVEIVCVSTAFKPKRLPENIKQRLGAS